MRADDPLRELFALHGIDDPEAFLSKNGENAGVSDSEDPDVQVRGSIQLMMEPLLSRDTVERGLSELKYL